MPRRLPAAHDLEVSSLRAPKAGVSNETFRIEIHYRAGDETRHDRLVTRLEPRISASFLSTTSSDSTR